MTRLALSTINQPTTQPTCLSELKYLESMSITSSLMTQYEGTDTVNQYDSVNKQ